MNALLQPAFAERAMAVGDLDAVMTIEAGAYSFPWTRGNFIDSLAAGYHARVLESPASGIVAYVVAMPGAGEMHLLNLTVAPAWQHRGLARGLLDALEAECRARALPMLWLEVRQSNDRARELYRRRGFDEVGLRRGYYPAPASRREDAIVMSLRVPTGEADGVV